MTEAIKLMSLSMAVCPGSTEDASGSLDVGVNLV